eukprot:7242460-Prymnesium_polylepis.1
MCISRYLTARQSLVALAARQMIMLTADDHADGSPVARRAGGSADDHAARQMIMVTANDDADGSPVAGI